MGLLAVVFSVGAAYYYPWPQTDSAAGATGEKLFEEFEKQVWLVRLVEYDRETEGLQTLSLQRKGEKWVIPAKSNYPATGDLITGAIAALSEKTILGEESEDQQDHAKFGVLDPIDFQSATNRDSIGQKITLEDSNRTILGSLIVGDKVEKTTNQYYVRRPGQPKVYVIEFVPQFLTTQFANWLDSNMLNLNVANNYKEGTKVKSITIDNYRIDSDSINSAMPVNRYRAGLLPGGNLLAVKSLEFFENGALTVSTPDQSQKAQLGQIDKVLQSLQLINVQLKEEDLSRELGIALASVTDEVFVSANEIGFALRKDADTVSIVGSGGSISVVTDNGLRTNLIFGNITGSADSADELGHYMMITVEIDEALAVKPEKPEPKAGQELTEDEEREYARAVESWDKELKTVTQLAKDTNRVHSKWYYVLSDEFIAFLRPELSNADTGTEDKD